MPPESVLKLMRQSYWAPERDLATIRLALEYSIPVGALTEDGELVGFARIITDFATTYYLCDVIVDRNHRGRGVGKRMIAEIVGEPRLKNLLGLLLTEDAHGLYEPFGFVREGQRCMKKLRPGQSGEKRFKWFSASD